MSRRYIISLIVVVLAMVLASFAVMWIAPDRFLTVMPLLAVYFGAVCALQHWLVTRAMNRSPRTFIQVFLGSVVGVLLLHILVLAVYLLSHTTHARMFTLAFSIGYAVSLVFETAALVRFVNNERRRRQQNQD